MLKSKTEYVKYPGLLFIEGLLFIKTDLAHLDKSFIRVYN